MIHYSLYSIQYYKGIPKKETIITNPLFQRNSFIKTTKLRIVYPQTYLLTYLIIRLFK